MPAVNVPSDLQPLEFLLSEVHPSVGGPLPRRLGDLAGGLLAEAITRGDHRNGQPGFLRALFTLVESLPVSENVEEFLNDLAATGRLLDWPTHGDLDFHLFTLRALVHHQRSAQGQSERLINLWKRELQDLRYAPIALQGLLRLSAPTAIDALPAFVERSMAATPPRSLVNTLYALSLELGSTEVLWQRLIRVFDRHPVALQAPSAALSKTRLLSLSALAGRQTFLAHAQRQSESPQETPVLSLASRQRHYAHAL